MKQGFVHQVFSRLAGEDGDRLAIDDSGGTRVTFGQLEESANRLACYQYVKEVRPTNRLTTSPVCLVGPDMDYSPQIERLLQMGEGGRPKQRRIMELNPQYEIFIRMVARFRQNKNEVELGKYADLLLSYAPLAEGSDLPDPVGFNQLVAELMIQTLSNDAQSPG